jgi:membrane protease YdiL (CAAX protease family)
LTAVLAGSLVFVFFVAGFNWVAKSLWARTVASGLRQRVTGELTAGMIAEIAVLLVLILLMRHRGVALQSLGLWRPAPLKGWVVAALVAALFLAFNVALPLRAEKNLAEISVFYIYNAVSAAFVAGFVEETLFRGFVMTELRLSGWGNVAQVVISSLVYGAVLRHGAQLPACLHGSYLAGQ